MIELNELEIARYDRMFGTRSRYFPCTNTIIIETPLDSWQVRITNRQVKPYCLLHKNKFGRTNKYHIQTQKTSLYYIYDTIYKHKNPMININKNKIKTCAKRKIK